MTRMTPKRRGRCRYCGQLFGLTKLGKVWRHLQSDGKTVCGGSGQLPS